MLLHIADHKTVEDIQDHFSTCFPLLKMEFFHDPGANNADWNKKRMVDPKTRIGEIRKHSAPGILDIKSWDKTARVKQLIREAFGLQVQIYRWYKNEWIPTSYSDELTLKQQCELATENSVFQPQ